MSDLPHSDPLKDAAELNEFDVVWVGYGFDRDEIPPNQLGRRDIEPVKIMALPTKKEPRYYVQSVWRDIFFYVSADRFLDYNPLDTIKKA